MYKAHTYIDNTVLYIGDWILRNYSNLFKGKWTILPLC